MENTERLFLGLHLYPLFKDEIEACAAQLREIYPEHKWAHLQNVHFTIHFLGEVAVDKKLLIETVARQVASDLCPFQIALENMGAFPSLNKPRVIWIGVSKECQPDLNQLYQKITKPLIAQGFPVEHETFTPHATLFRVRVDKLIQWDPEVFQFPKTPLRRVDKLTLFKSTLNKWGSEYVPIQDFLFSKAE